MYTAGRRQEHVEKNNAIFLPRIVLVVHQSFITRSTESSRDKIIHVEITVKNGFLLLAQLTKCDCASLSVFLKIL